MISLGVSRPRQRLSGDSRERFQRISDLSEADRSFPHFLTMEFLTNVGLILAKVALELVDAPLEMGTVLWSVVSAFFSRSLF